MNAMPVIQESIEEDLLSLLSRSIDNILVPDENSDDSPSRIETYSKPNSNSTKSNGSKELSLDLKKATNLKIVAADD